MMTEALAFSLGIIFCLLARYLGAKIRGYAKDVRLSRTLRDEKRTVVAIESSYSPDPQS